LKLNIWKIIIIIIQSINQSSLRLFEKKTLLTQTQEGCTIELKNIIIIIIKITNSQVYIHRIKTQTFSAQTTYQVN